MKTPQTLEQRAGWKSLPVPIKKRRIGDSRQDIIFNIIVSIVGIIILLCVLLPLMHVVSASFSSPNAVTSGRVGIFPVEPGIGAYIAIFEYATIWRAYLNTVIYTTVGTIFSVTMTILAGYPLSRDDFGMRKFYTVLFIFTMLFSGGLIPFYLVVLQLGMINTFWAMIIPWGVSVWNIIITRTFFRQTVSGELLDASRIDGCSDFSFVLRIVLPLSGAIIAVNVLFYAVGRWNSFFDALLFLRDADRMPLQIVLRRILIQNQVSGQMTAFMGAAGEAELARFRELIKYAVIVVASAPVLALYPFVQKYFVKGLMIGSVKG